MTRFISTLACVAILTVPAIAQRTSEITVRHGRGWSDFGSEGWCAVKVWVDDEAEFALQGDRLLMVTTRGQDARNVATECSGPLPANVESFRFKGVDGRGEVRLLEEPTARNRWRAIVRIRDTKGGGEEYHYRLEWGRGSILSSGGGRGGNYGSGGNNSGSGGGFFSGSGSSQDLSRMRTRDLRIEIDRMHQNIVGRRPSQDVIDEYIDHVRFDRWNSSDIARDLERRR